MIIVEVFVPAIDNIYEFRLNEDVAVNVVIEEIISVICQKEQCPLKGERADFLLVLGGKQQVLSSNLSLYENGVQSGDRLIML